MNVAGKPYRTIWADTDAGVVWVIDQRQLPHRFATLSVRSCEQMAAAISNMTVRGAPLIGAAAAWGIALAMSADASDGNLMAARQQLLATRPTAVNLRNILDEMTEALAALPAPGRAAAARKVAQEVCNREVAICGAIGEHGLPLLKPRRGSVPGGPINVLTHCNAGWLAGVDLGMALAPVYRAHDRGIAVHVWVDETRPRNQGAALTAWELGQHGVPHTVITDNAGGHLMQHGRVDLCIVGTDRTTASGDVCNKIGTYLKALAAHDNGVPFYAAVPSSSIDWTLHDGVSDIPIEERTGDEVAWVAGVTRDGTPAVVRVTPDGSPVCNPGFDVTPARLITALITERGVCPATPAGLQRLFPGGATKAIAR